MNELLYTAQDLAIILIGMDLDCRIESAVMDRIWNREKEFLAEPYRQDRRKFTLEVLYWRHYFSEKTTLDRELPGRPERSGIRRPYGGSGGVPQ